MVLELTNISNDVRVNSGLHLSGDDLGKLKSVLYVSRKRSLARGTTQARQCVADSLQGLKFIEMPIDWQTRPDVVNATSSTINDRLIEAFPWIDDGSICGVSPICLKDEDGNFSSSFVMNQPKIWGLAGEDATQLIAGNVYAIVGKHFRTTFGLPSIYLWNLKWPVDIDELIEIIPIRPGGNGTGNTADHQRNVAFFRIPQNVTPGTYALLAFSNENEWGLSSPTFTVTVRADADPWIGASRYIAPFQPFMDITGIIENWMSTTVATDVKRQIVMLPPGTFYLSRQLSLKPFYGIVGSGIHSTRLMINPNIVGDFQAVSGAADMRVMGRTALIRPMGDNYFRDLEIQSQASPWNAPARHAIAAQNADRVKFDRVRVYSPSGIERNGYADGLFYRAGRWRFWSITNCELEGVLGFEATNGPLNGFKNNGSVDYSLLMNTSFRGVNGKSAASQLGSFLGRGTLIFGIDIQNSRRGIAMNAGDGSCQSVIQNVSMSNMLSEIWNGEGFLWETASAAQMTIARADQNSFTVANDTMDRTRWTAAIVEGRGAGQFRLIASSKDGTHSLDSPWRIIPDTTSKMIVVQCPTDVAIVGNRGVNMFGGFTVTGSAFGMQFNSNWLVGSHEGIRLNTIVATENCVGDFGQSGTGVAAVEFVTMRGNGFEDGAGVCLTASRTDKGNDYLKGPQMFAISIFGHLNFGEVVNELAQIQGEQRKGMPSKLSLVNGVMDCRSFVYTGKERYLHPIIGLGVMSKSFWTLFGGNVGNARELSISGASVDDMVTANGNQLVFVAGEFSDSDDLSMLGIIERIRGK